MKLTCEVIWDLLPGYAEGLTSEDSNALVDEHLKSCENCRKLLQGLADEAQKRLPVEAEIEPLKKYRKHNLMLKVLLWLSVSLLILAVVLPFAFERLELQYQLWKKNTPNEIYAIVATDCATGERLVLPFSYAQGAVSDDGALFYDETHFVSEETAQALAERINREANGCQAEAFDDNCVLISAGSSRYRIYKCSGGWYNWCFEGLSSKFASTGSSYYQFPVYLCQDADKLIDGFNNCPADLTSTAILQDFIDFYADTGLYRFTADGNEITLLGYAKEERHSGDTLYPQQFPVRITFTEQGGTMTLRVG